MLSYGKGESPPRFHCCVSTPLELAMVPARRASCSVACRSARANALNVASTMWWLLRPASCAWLRVHVWGRSGAAEGGSEEQARGKGG